MVPDVRLHTAILVMLVALSAACTRPEQLPDSVMAALPADGWAQGAALRLSPLYGDSTRCYDLRLDVRHTTAYPYRDLHLIVDLVGDSGTVDRRVVDLDLADGYGNWSGSGFGTLYQHSVMLARDVPPRRARMIAVWQTMDSVDRLAGLDAIGVTAFPVNR